MAAATSMASLSVVAPVSSQTTVASRAELVVRSSTANTRAVVLPARLPSISRSASLLCRRAERSHSYRVAVKCAVASEEAYGTVDVVVDDDYLAVGKAHCFIKDNLGKLQDVWVIEPVTAGTLECMDNGGVTSYEVVTGVKWATVKDHDVSKLPPVFADAKFCEEFDFRAACTVRTWRRPHAQESLLNIVAIGDVRSDFNLKLENKRVLNAEHVVNDSDNIKQDMSIDVYNRKEDEEDIAKLYEA